MSLGTLSNVNVDVTDIKMATGSWYFLSFQYSNSTNSYTGSRNKGIQIHCVGQKLSIYKRDIELAVAIHDVQDVSAFFASARYFWLRAVPFQSVESRLGKTRLERAKLPRGELERQREAPPQFPLGWPWFFFFFRSHRSISSLARPPWGTARSLMWLKRSKLPYLPWLRFLNPFCFFQWIRVCSWWRTSNRRLGPGSARHVRRWAPWTRCSASVRIWGIPRGR